MACVCHTPQMLLRIMERPCGTLVYETVIHETVIHETVIHERLMDHAAAAMHEAAVSHNVSKSRELEPRGGLDQEC